MATQKKFGTFAGVFTPSILTILGVIMYMRMGWVVGNAGLWGTILIVLIAHIISVSTGLSISSIATDKKVGAGGVYYVLSRSLGLPIGGAIGLTLFVGTAFSIALYLVGFSESLNAYLGLDTSVNGLRSSASLALLVLTIIAFISTSVAIKTQFFILLAIILSLVSIFWGTSNYVPETVAHFGGEDSASLEEVFAIYFPAVTGFTAGIAMSGDLRNPKKSIPGGTIASIAVGFVVYMVLAFFIAYNINPETLRTDNNILMKIAMFAPLVVAGVWGATLSSALGGILGGPRILQAMSVDKITPKLFGKGVGKGNEPRNALILTVIVAEAGILIGELDLIARVVSMFYLAAYGFINISFFLESWASADFKPSFKVNKLVGLVGFIATFAVMFKLDMLAMIAAIVIIGGIYLWLARRQITLGTGDIWQSVWSTLVKTGLKRMDAKDDHKRNWKPNILLFSGSSATRPHLLEFSKALAGQAGIVTNFDLVENKDATVLFPKHKQSFTDDILQKYGIFGRRIEVKNVFKGIETIATTFGFSGLDPNTALMGWARNTKDPIWFAQMTQKLIDLDYNVLYLDYDERWGFRKREQIDLWWRGISNNAELMLHLAKFINVSPEWRNAHIRILLVNDYNLDRKIIENRIEQLLEEFRVEAEINIINNTIDKKPFYELMKVISADADLVFIGIPNISPGEEASFVERTNNLVSIIGTTLLVKASSTFEVTKLGLKTMEDKPDVPMVRRLELPSLVIPQQENLANALYDLDDNFENSARSFSENTLAVLQQHYLQLIGEIEESLSSLFLKLKEERDKDAAHTLAEALQNPARLSKLFREEELELVKNVLAEGIAKFLQAREGLIAAAQKILKVDVTNPEEYRKQTHKIAWKKALQYHHRSSGVHGILQAMYDLGMVHLALLGNARRILTRNLTRLQSELGQGKDNNQAIEKVSAKVMEDFVKLRQLAREIVENPFYHLRKTDREICNFLATNIPEPGFNNLISIKKRKLKRRKVKAAVRSIQQYASDWERNQQLLHRRFETGLVLSGAMAKLKGYANEACEAIQEGFLEKVKTNLHPIENAIPIVRECLEANEFERIANTRIQLEEEDFVNPDHIFFRLTESIDTLVSHLPEEVELMDAASFNAFNEDQGDSVNVDGLSIDKIADFLIETNFVAPFQKKLLSFTSEMNQLNGKVADLANLLNYGIELAKEEDGSEGLPEILRQAEKELAAANESAELLFESFTSEIGEKLEATEPTLDIRSITEEASQLTQYVRKQRRQKGISMWVQNVEAGLQQNVDQAREFVSRKKQDVAMVNFEKRHAALQGTPAVLRSFVEKVSIAPEVDEKLPFYYKQLFSGKHLNPGRKIDNRRREIEEAVKAVRHIREGIGGGILVTGEVLSGKSFFCEHIAYQIIGGDVFHVTPPEGGSVSAAKLEKAFQSATGKKGPLKWIMQSLPPGTVFILNDIEMWWLKTEGGDQLIEQLVQAIEEFGSRHFFLLNGNLHTYAMLRHTTGLLRCLVSTIVLAPMSKAELRKVIWNRHKTGGLALRYKDRPEDQLSEKNGNRLFSRLYHLSGGKPGFALWLWLNSIKNFEDGVIELELPIAHEFPELKSAGWKSLLLQFFLHKSLSQKHLFKLYAGEDKDWIKQMIAELRKSGITEEPVKDVFVLKKEIRPYLESWLREKEMIK